MANVHLHIPSFNAGELSPLLGARFAVEKVQSGCRLMRNFIPHVHGPAFRRPGMEYLGANVDSAHRSELRGFNFSTSTGYILELHEDGLAIWNNGAKVTLVAPVAWPYSEAECAEVQIAQVNDVCYIAHPAHPPRQLTRHAHDDWRLAEIDWKWPALGDENVRISEVAAPVVTQLLAIPLGWPEMATTAGSHTFSIQNFVSGATAKRAILEFWDVSAWTDWPSAVLDWTTTAPTPFAFTTFNSYFFRFKIPETYPSAPGGEARLVYPSGTTDLSLAGTPASPLSVVTVPADTPWQVTVKCPATLGTSAALTLQKWNGSAWVTHQVMTLTTSQTVTTRQDALTASTDMRFLYAGRTTTGGEARIELLDFGASDEINLSVDGVNGSGRTMTASEPLFQAGHVGSFWQITHRRDLAYAEIVAVAYGFSEMVSEEIRVAGKWDVFTYGAWDATLYLERNVAGVWEGVRSWSSAQDRNIIATGQEDQGALLRLRLGAGTGAAASGAAVPRFVLEAADARVDGIVKVTAVGTLDGDGLATTATVDVVVTLHSSLATPLWTEGAWSTVKGYPRTVALHGQRLWFGGTSAEPLRIWGSLVNDYLDFRRTTLEDASVSFTPAAQQSNALQWMASYEDDLILGTLGDEWTLSGGLEGKPISPTSVSMQRRSGYGSDYQASLLLGEVIVFVQRGGRRVRQVAPRSDGTVWAAADLMVLSEHIAARGIRQFAVMHFPQSILWAVTNDGMLLGMTYEQEQNVFAWHVHETDGLVESVAVLFGTESDEVWLSVNRDGARGIERLDAKVMARRFDEAETLIYLDAAKRFTGSGLTSLTGLSHLNGKLVTILRNGIVETTQTVSGGVLTITAADDVIVGLPFTSELQPMRLEIPLRDGTAQHRNWRVSRVGLYLHDSRGGEVADAPGERYEQLKYPSGTALYSGESETPIESRTRAGVDVVVRTSSARPLNVGSITLKGDVYGE